jgi:hypothetical protein
VADSLRQQAYDGLIPGPNEAGPEDGPGPRAEPRRLAMRDFTLRGHRAATILILTALAGCDNVKWGGISVQKIDPPPAIDVAQVHTTEEGPTNLGLPSGSVLFHVIRAADGTTRIIPVAELSGDSLRGMRRPAGVSPEAYEQRFRVTVLSPNAQFALFRRGAPVGTFTLQRNAPLTACGLPTGLGVATTVAAAAGEREFIAFRKGLEPDIRGEFPTLSVDGPIRRYASLVAERLVLQGGLARPRSWPGALRDLQALDVTRGGHPEMSATHLVGDTLAVGGASPDGWSVFYLASYQDRAGYMPVYQETSDYRKTGKRAPAVVDYLNWDRTPESEVLVRVFGAREDWYEVLSSQRGRWVRAWEAQRCRTE